MDIQDKIKGVIYGQAIGDALGLGTEFFSKKSLKVFYPKGYKDYSQIVQDNHRKRWQKGAWTDDTDQMLCILDSLLEMRQVDIKDIAQKIYLWAISGGKGIGRTIYSVLTHPYFKLDPYRVSQEVWNKSGKNAAANGGVMRTSILGIWEYQNESRVISNAEAVCKITHFDPRCIDSCVVTCLIISKLLQGKTKVKRILEEVFSANYSYDPRTISFVKTHLKKRITTLELDKKDSIGYTLKALACGIWALKYASSYEKGVLKIIREGGDADTNASVAGAVLGAKFGYSKIPTRLIEGLQNKVRLDERIDDIILILSKYLEK